MESSGNGPRRWVRYSVHVLGVLSPVPEGGQEEKLTFYVFITVETTGPKQDKSQHGAFTGPDSVWWSLWRGQGSSQGREGASWSDDSVLGLSCGGGCAIVANFTARKLHFSKAAPVDLSSGKAGEMQPQPCPDRLGPPGSRAFPSHTTLEWDPRTCFTRAGTEAQSRKVAGPRSHGALVWGPT